MMLFLKKKISFVFIVSVIMTVELPNAAAIARQHPLDTDAACTGDFLLPDKPFIVVWNQPTGGCEAHGINLNLSAWGITENDNDSFAGDNMIIYYGLGHWPTYNGKTKVKYNGGVPQAGNLTYHLEEVKQQVMGLKSNFSGISVIDFESWRPLYVHNFDSLAIYQQLSLDIVHEKFPNLSKQAAEAEAQKEFDAGAKDFFAGTLNATYSLRPEGHWGYYGFPRNWGGPGGEAQNDMLAYIWTKSTGLYPSIYMSDEAQYPPTAERIQGTINETLRVWAKFSKPGTLILPYTLCQQNGTNFFSEENLTLAIGLPANMGAAGVVIWGSSSFFYTPKECLLQQKYISSVLGPYVKNLTDFFAACSSKLCSGHGRCIRKDFETIIQFHLKASGRKHCRLTENMLQLEKDTDMFKKNIGYPLLYDDYICRCLTGWTGEHCDKGL